MPLELVSRGDEPDYDKEKYRGMLSESSSNRYCDFFGFERTVYGDRKKNSKWWYDFGKNVEKI